MKVTSTMAEKKDDKWKRGPGGRQESGYSDMVARGMQERRGSLSRK